MSSPSFSPQLENNHDMVIRDFGSASINPPYEICFGMLCDIQMQWISAAGHRSANETSASTSEDTFEVKLLLYHERCEITDMLGNAIATLNIKTHLALKKLTSVNQIYFKGYIRQDDQDHLTSTVIQPDRPAKKPRKSAQNPKSSVDLLVFGPREIADVLAKELAQYRLFLQHPFPLPSDVPYENPQYFHIDGVSLSNGSLLPPIQCLDNAEDGSDALSSREDDVQQDTDLAHVLDHLPQHNYLKEANIDRRISTPLLSHQKEAVDFILRRESPSPLNPRSLWELSDSDRDGQVYLHLITGLTSDKPEDTPGGILADAMGVGKTLTMIASIASSLREAKRFVSEQSQRVFLDGRKNHPTHSTLILVPSALLLDGWVAEIEKHVSQGTLRYYQYHGQNRSLPLSSDLPYDIVFSTYGTVAADFRRGGGVLSSFKWYRLVLDEAHVIRNLTTKQFKAVAELDAVIRWCMTGTPIQNSLEDLSSLVRFLKVPILDDTSTFRRYIIGRKKTAIGILKPDFAKLKLLLGSICLRRSTSVLSVLGVTFTTCRPSLSSKERDAYNELALACKRSIEEAISSQNSRRPDQKPVLEALLRMRIFCNVGLGIGEATLTRPDETVTLLQQSGEAICDCCNAYCDAIYHQAPPYLSGCHRLVCPECISQYQQEAKRTPRDSGVCHYRAEPGWKAVHSKEMNTATSVSSYLECSAKSNALFQNIRQQDAEEKSIVFSSWIRSLDAIARLLAEHNITFRRIDGSVPHAQKMQMLSEFQHDPSIRVFLMTFGIGAVGLNQLSVANRLHLLEPQWNPQVESQAIGRVIRLGQENKVTVTRYVIKSTIEESVESRQALKLRLAFDGGLQSSSPEHGERIRDLRELAKVIQIQL
ncbi:SNF2 family N-terminal domain-containing protein [Xylariaceae sp. FL0662B]|nr:SNF2 family N-terminal domain-containing protein [Xylariaceae sp. FL0662B]